VNELLSLVGVLNNKSVVVSRSSDLELGLSSVLLDGGGSHILSSRKLKEKLDVL